MQLTLDANETKMLVSLKWYEIFLRCVTPGGRGLPVQGNIPVNPVRLKENKGEKIGKVFLFLPAQPLFLSHTLPSLSQRSLLLSLGSTPQTPSLQLQHAPPSAHFFQEELRG